MRTSFAVKRPNKTRRTFAVIRDVVYADNRREQVTVEDEAIDALNRNLKAGLIGEGDADIQIATVIIPRLKAQAGLQSKLDAEMTVSEHNLAVFRKYWVHVTKETELKNPVSTRNDLFAAIRAIDPLALATATKDELKAKLNRQTNKRYRRYAIRVNQLLRYLGREFQLPLKDIEQEEVHYISWDELQKILPNLPFDESRILATVLFCTGVRLGEAFAFSHRKLKSNRSIFVDKQLTHKFEKRGLKNAKPHDTVLLPQGVEAYKAWCDLPEEKRNKLRNTISHQLLVASRKTFSDKERHVSPHDLRHSYAIHLLERGATVTEIAYMLGDTEATVRRHYTGWIATDRMVENINRLLAV